jgi:hypothetical protein
MQGLSVDAKRGHPVPFFVAWFTPDMREVPPGTAGATPDYAVVSTGKRDKCWKEQRCWLCGGKLGRHHAHVIGPMCAVNRTTSEPASHLACAAYAVQACPFLSNPAARMIPIGKKVEKHSTLVAPAGVMLERNPGAACIWVSGRSTPFEAPGGYLFRIPEPSSVTWWCKGRPATRAEIVHSINTGIPHLVELANKQAGAIEALQQYIDRVDRYLPSGPDALTRVWEKAA